MFNQSRSCERFGCLDSWNVFYGRFSTISGYKIIKRSYRHMHLWDFGIICLLWKHDIPTLSLPYINHRICFKLVKNVGLHCSWTDQQFLYNETLKKTSISAIWLNWNLEFGIWNFSNLFSNFDFIEHLFTLFHIRSHQMFIIDFYRHRFIKLFLLRFKRNTNIIWFEQKLNFSLH